MKKSRMSAAMAITVVYLLIPNLAAQEDPQVFAKLDDSFAAITIGDVKELLEEVSTLVNRAAPGMGEMIPAQVGQFLGDPDLEGFEEGAGLTGVVFPGDQVVVFAEIAAAKREEYEAHAKSQGMQAAIADNLLLLSDSESGIATGKKVAGEVSSALLAENDRGSLEGFLHVPKLFEAYQDAIDSGLAGVFSMMKSGMAASATGTQDLGAVMNILEAEVFAFYNILKQVDIASLDVLPNRDGLTLDFSLMPRPNTNFATFLESVALRDSPDLIGPLPPDGTVRFEAQYDADALKKFVNGETDSLLAAVEWTEEEEADLRKLIGNSLVVYGKGFAGSLLGPSEELLSGAFLYRTDDPERSLELVKEMATDMDAFGLGDLYKGLGMEMKFDYQEAVRVHREVPIHRMEANFETDDSMPEESRSILKLFADMSYEMAVVEDLLVYTMGDSPIEEVLDNLLGDRPSGATPLVSKDRLGEDGLFYMDLSLEGYLRLIGEIMKEVVPKPEDEGGPDAIYFLGAAAEAFRGAPPILFAKFAGSGGAQLKVQIPAGLLDKASRATMGGAPPGEDR